MGRSIQGKRKGLRSRELCAYKHKLSFRRKRETTEPGSPNTLSGVPRRTYSSKWSWIVSLQGFPDLSSFIQKGRKADQRVREVSECPSKEPERIHFHPGLLNSGLKQGRWWGPDQSHSGRLRRGAHDNGGPPDSTLVSSMPCGCICTKCELQDPDACF